MISVIGTPKIFYALSPKPYSNPGVPPHLCLCRRLASGAHEPMLAMRPNFCLLMPSGVFIFILGLEVLVLYFLGCAADSEDSETPSHNVVVVVMGLFAFLQTSSDQKLMGTQQYMGSPFAPRAEARA